MPAKHFKDEKLQRVLIVRKTTNGKGNKKLFNLNAATSSSAYLRCRIKRFRFFFLSGTLKEEEK